MDAKLSFHSGHSDIRWRWQVMLSVEVLCFGQADIRTCSAEVPRNVLDGMKHGTMHAFCSHRYLCQAAVAAIQGLAPNHQLTVPAGQETSTGY